MDKVAKALTPRMGIISSVLRTFVPRTSQPESLPQCLRAAIRMYSYNSYNVHRSNMHRGLCLAPT